MDLSGPMFFENGFTVVPECHFVAVHSLRNHGMKLENDTNTKLKEKHQGLPVP
jgi:hypothetical protein